VSLHALPRGAKRRKARAEAENVQRTRYVKLHSVRNTGTSPPPSNEGPGQGEAPWEYAESGTRTFASALSAPDRGAPGAIVVLEPAAAPEFGRAALGYNRPQVDAYVQDLRERLAEMRARARRAETELRRVRPAERDRGAHRVWQAEEA